MRKTVSATKRAVFVALVVAMIAGCDDAKKSGAKGGIPDEWTHKEVLARLNEKGLKLKMVTTNVGGAFGVPAYFVTEASGLKEGEAAQAAHEKKSPDVVHVLLMKSAQDAKDEAGASDKAFAAGRFLFTGQKSQLDKIRGALP